MSHWRLSNAEQRQPGRTSATLLLRVRSGDPEGWRQLVDLYAPVVYGWCRYAGLQAAEAADVVQDVFTSVLQSLEKYAGGREGSFRAWLHTITRRRLADYLERRGPVRAAGGSTAQKRLLDLPEIPQPSSTTGADPGSKFVYCRALEWVRAEFGPHTWRAFWRVVVDGQRPADVAEELGMSLYAVYKAKSRVLRRLREELGGLENVCS